MKGHFYLSQQLHSYTKNNIVISAVFIAVIKMSTIGIYSVLTVITEFNNDYCKQMAGAQAFI